ncbi:polyamine aminopropyltransferase [Filobacillus milosensis]|uniref:Polyamine aminopropyltransferase n=1 Tax=Filobacillus milosensis TaxID=94137 RepID=A0A4Y8IT78_9BACI|nr:polyamine aminopropyltransferase [Filobacillus milosensis]TFB25110.1 polyamine aminopropyltransferase [Filobacillus milosensis]
MANHSYLYLSSAIVSICGIVYQVLYGAAGSYLFGDSVFFYCMTIGLFLMFMGVGAAFSEYIKHSLMNRFVQTEYLIAILGGFSVLGLFFCMSYYGVNVAQMYLYIVISVTGFLTGIELPILIRKAQSMGEEIGRSTARVLFFDYAGSLIGAVGFALLLRPTLGLIKTAFFVACINILVALIIAFVFKHELKRPKLHQFSGVLITIVLIFGFLYGEGMAFKFEQKLYADPIVYHEKTKYQKIILTKNPGDTRLYLDGQLQFSESDEYRYHEALVHVPMALAESHQNVLILGGGDGIVAREVLKYKGVKKITLVDLDQKMTNLAKTHPELTRINNNSLHNEKVNIINDGAFHYLMTNENFFDVIIVDLPDPNNEALNKLYTREFYSLVRNHLLPGGYTSIQSTSPIFATEAFWTINKTVKSTGLKAKSYHLDVPSFGNWGFTLASRDEINLDNIDIPVETQYLTNDIVPTLFKFGKDADSTIVREGKTFDIPVNSLNRPVLMGLYNQAWKYY